jgi:cyclopropane-fatty-acyl-phospholipid synthase
MDEYFRRCRDLLRPGGTLLIQAIVIADEFYEQAKGSVDFIKQYIFPGSHLPSLGSISRSAVRTDRLRAVGLQDLTLHYARTLELWRERFLNRILDVRALGYSDRFIRMWEFYLSYCEAGFLERHIRDVHLVFKKLQADF